MASIDQRRRFQTNFLTCKLHFDSILIQIPRKLVAKGPVKNMPIFVQIITWRTGDSALTHYGDVIMSVMASQITSVTIVHWTVCSEADQQKRLSSASLVFVRGIHRWPVNSSHTEPVTRKMFPFDDVIMEVLHLVLSAKWRPFCSSLNVSTEHQTHLCYFQQLVLEGGTLYFAEVPFL